ncbi:hypothetical protein PS684_02169 [Pseudomonas fluorescens]|nr:hypothetical protein PS681_01832 [Pseudomonas fluorescens]VVN55740.1 hypothetical protein PS684_02169 [Pseudomonas fluorescens]
MYPKNMSLLKSIPLTPALSPKGARGKGADLHAVQNLSPARSLAEKLGYFLRGAGQMLFMGKSGNLERLQVMIPGR